MNKKDLIQKRGHKCENCSRTRWLGKAIPLEIHHANPPSEKEADLQLLCPNCHAFTDNYRGRGIKTVKHVTDKELAEAVAKSQNLRQVLIHLKLVAKGGNYESIRKRIIKLGLKEKFIAKDKQATICLCCGFLFVSQDELRFCSQSCSNKYNAQTPRKTKINWPDCATLLRLTEEVGFVETGRRLGVSDNAVRKRLKRHGTQTGKAAPLKPE